MKEQGRKGGGKKAKPRNSSSPLTSNERARRLRLAELIERVQGPLRLDPLPDPFQAQGRSCEPPQSAIRGTSLSAERVPSRVPTPRGGACVHGRDYGHWMSLKAEMMIKKDGTIASKDRQPSAFGYLVIAM